MSAKERNVEYALHHYTADQYEGFEVWVACAYDHANSTMEVSGIEYREDCGFVYFTFGELAHEFDIENDAEFLKYLLDSTEKGYSCSGYRDTDELFSDEYNKDDALLQKVRNIV